MFASQKEALMATRYTKDHEWIRLDGDVATVGITEHAQNALGDIVYVELPEIGTVSRSTFLVPRLGRSKVQAG